ncbi:MAG: thiamine pyrophosphate-dependent dehydrogenase E1 component subunit alpha [Chloroflexales bacterium]|nr:thiamine pyrophosphate-dependent dehydrogenase E1 component subunit alpha [Chloroflexales bacterium]
MIEDTPVEVVLDLYTRMLRIRRFEEQVGALFAQGQLPGFVHLYVGEEAVGAGVCAALRSDDYIVSTHRGHGHVLAKGGDMRRMMAELFGKSTGYCKGKGGSMHIADFSIGVLGACGIVGGGIPVAVGAAFSAHYRASGQVAVSFFGDGAANEGSFHESLNLASTLRLPAIFVCENNGYGEFTPASRAMNIRDIADRAAGYGIPGVIVDGTDALAVHEVASAAVARARAGAGPTLIEAKTHRKGGHAEGEKAFLAGQQYRLPDELAAMEAGDPISRLHHTIIERALVPPDQLEELDQSIADAVSDAVAFARSSPDPGVEVLFEDMWA